VICHVVKQQCVPPIDTHSVSPVMCQSSSKTISQPVGHSVNQSPGRSVHKPTHHVSISVRSVSLSVSQPTLQLAVKVIWVAFPSETHAPTLQQNKKPFFWSQNYVFFPFHGTFLEMLQSSHPIPPPFPHNHTHSKQL
jgi:hypothetical protein